MFILGWSMLFMLGATIGFVLACVTAARRVAYLSREVQLLQEELERYQNLFGVVADQNQVDTMPLILQAEFPQAQDLQ